MVGSKVGHSNNQSKVRFYLFFLCCFRLSVINLFGYGLASRTQTLFHFEFQTKKIDLGAMKILVTGSNGLLGQKIVGQLVRSDITFLATSTGANRNTNCSDYCYRSMDISNDSQVKSVFQFFSPDYVIHTAAITNVDYCEENKEECQKINVEGTKNLFESAQEINAHLLLLSTDFVFDGEKGNYIESDQPNPLSIYGTSKYEAEKEAGKMHPGSLGTDKYKEPGLKNADTLPKTTI